MKSLISSIKQHPQYAKVFEWGKLISITGAAQIIVQATSLISGILIIRLLPTDEYALYTLANTMLGTMTLLSDGGISSGVMSQGGKVWKDKERLGIVLSTGLNLRRIFATCSLVIAIPILVYLLIRHGASYLTSALIVFALVPAFLAALSDSLLEIIPKLHQNIKPLQRNQVVVSLVRLVFTCMSLFFFPFTYIAIFAAGIPRIIGNIRLKKIVYKQVPKVTATDKVVKDEILSIVKRVLPTSLYYSVSGQLTIWLMSFFGTTVAIAQIGALSRITIVLTLFATVISIVSVPRFSRLADNKQLLFKYFIGTLIFLVFCFTSVYILSYFFSDQILFVLGKQYYGLNKELLLYIIGSSISLLAGTSFTLYSSRGWAMFPVVIIAIDLAAVVIGLFLFKISSVTGVLYYNIFTASALFITNSVFLTYKITKTKSNDQLA